ncbi:LysM peptidoglycan-binding domain-containing protein [Paenisporosarcina sp. TG20]|uniref:LysM peptidoglycan-binding domain-containing protein n=1 Tax=Paenisporosarcina sp. TG20 TaxID=1211706 RepID=UPI0002E875CE|nr:LysM peptidoglycan-binding domain-containing protein [Paenisporosarcina sp. TG20]
MDKEDYKTKIDKHRKPIQINGEDKPNTHTRTSRRSNKGTQKKTKQKKNILLPILFFFFILIPISLLIYVFVFYQPNSNETTVFDNSQVQYEQNKKYTPDEEDSEITEPTPATENKTVTENTPKESEEPQEKPVIAEDAEDAKVDEPTAKTHVVKVGDTLYSIALNYYSSPDAVERIKSANNLTTNAISVDETLILP